MPIPQNLARALLLTCLFCFIPAILSANSATIDEETEQAALYAAANVVDHFLSASQDRDFDRAARLLSNFHRYEPHARQTARYIYQRNNELFENFAGAGSELSSYQVNRDLFRNLVVVLEGELLSTDGTASGFKAEVIYQKKRWLIRSFKIDRAS